MISNLNEGDIAKILEEPKNGSVKFTMNGFKEYNGEHGWLPVPAVDVQLTDLLLTYEDLVDELSDKEVCLFRKKEVYNALSSSIIESTDFKALYGKNNEKIRKQHVKEELSDEYKELKDLEFSIDWINRYIVFLRELIRTK